MPLLQLYMRHAKAVHASQEGHASHPKGFCCCRRCCGARGPAAHSALCLFWLAACTSVEHHAMLLDLFRLAACYKAFLHLLGRLGSPLAFCALVHLHQAFLGWLHATLPLSIMPGLGPVSPCCMLHGILTYFLAALEALQLSASRLSTRHHPSNLAPK